jgi:hypothetical protein
LSGSSPSDSSSSSLSWPLSSSDNTWVSRRLSFLCALEEDEPDVGFDNDDDDDDDNPDICIREALLLPLLEEDSSVRVFKGLDNAEVVGFFDEVGAVLISLSLLLLLLPLLAPFANEMPPLASFPYQTQRQSTLVRVSSASAVVS